MAQIRLPYVQEWVDKKTGKVYRRFRRRHFKCVPLPGLPGSDEFMAAYQAALDAPHVEIGATRTKAGTVSAAIAAYYTSLEFRSLTGGTPAMRRAILERFRAAHGDKPIAMLPRKFIVLTLSKLGPFAARNWLKAIRHLMQFALSQEMCAEDPTQGIKLPRTKSTGHHSWEETEIATYEAAYPIGTKARLALALLLYSTQRREDVVLMGRQHIRKVLVDGADQEILFVNPIKTRTTTNVALAIPVHPMLRAIIDATPGDHLTFLTTKTGKPYSPNGFSEQFRAWCDAAKLPRRCVAHGLRKASCTRLADAGCNPFEIAAYSGHASLKELQRYTKAADLARAARSGMVKLLAAENAKATSSVKTGKV
jgi:integrase